MNSRAWAVVLSANSAITETVSSDLVWVIGEFRSAADNRMLRNHVDQRVPGRVDRAEVRQTNWLAHHVTKAPTLEIGVDLMSRLRKPVGDHEVTIDAKEASASKEAEVRREEREFGDDKDGNEHGIDVEATARRVASLLSQNKDFHANLVWPLLESQEGKRKIAILGLEGTASRVKVAIGVILTALGLSYTALWIKTTGAISEGIMVMKALDSADDRMKNILADLKEADSNITNVNSRISDTEARFEALHALAIDNARVAAMDKAHELHERLEERFDERVNRIETRMISNQNVLASDTRRALTDFGTEAAELKLEIMQAQRADQEFKSLLNATTGTIGSTSVGYAKAKNPLWLERERVSITINKLATAGASGVDIANHKGSVIARVATQPYGRPLHVADDGRCIALSIASPAGLRRRSIVVAHSYLRSVGKPCGESSYSASQSTVAESRDGNGASELARSDTDTGG